MNAYSVRHADTRTATSFTDIESGFGIGGYGSDDYNIWTETEIGGDEHPDYNDGGGSGKCKHCGKSGSHWNNGAGNYLCVRHWDEY